MNRNIDLDALSKSVVGYILSDDEDKKVDWFTQPRFLSSIANELARDIELTLTWAVDTDKLDVIKLLRENKATFENEMKITLAVALAEVFEISTSPEPNLTITTVRRYIGGLVTRLSSIYSFCAYLDEKVINKELAGLIRTKHEDANVLIDMINSLGVDEALARSNAFKKKTVNSRVDMLRQRGDIKGGVLGVDYEPEFDPEMDIEFSDVNDDDIDITNRQLDDILDPRDKDIAAMVAEEEAEVQKVLEFQAQGKRTEMQLEKQKKEALNAHRKKKPKKRKYKSVTETMRERRQAWIDAGCPKSVEVDFDYV